MEWNEILTLILSAISVIFTAGIGVATIILNVKISKINNIKEYKENNRHITPFELQFRDEEWLYDLIVNRDEFYKYDESSQRRIAKWFKKYAEKHNLTKLKVYNDLVEQEAEKAKEESKEEKPATQEPVKDGSAEVKVPRGIPSLRGGRKVKVTNIDPALAELASRIHIDCNTPTTVIHDYPVEGTLTPTPIIIDLTDEFDNKEEKK